MKIFERTVWLYERSPIGLVEILKDSIGIQCIITKKHRIFQGEISSYSFPSKSKKKFFLTFRWLCQQRIVTDLQGNRIIKWIPVPLPETGTHSLEINFRSYYMQTDENRVKIHAKGVALRILDKEEDYLRLIFYRGEYVYFYKVKDIYFKVIPIAILQKKQ